MHENLHLLLRQYLQLISSDDHALKYDGEDESVSSRSGPMESTPAISC